MESKQETIIYGGAFNPPTLAHQAILQACIDYAEPRASDVWLLPSANRRDKTIEVAEHRRLEFCQALAKDVICRTVELAINTTELDRDAITETYETVAEFKKRYPNREFVWVFGSDSFASMPTWRNGKWMQTHLQMLVIDRPGAPKVKIGSNAAWLPVQADEMSSTELRRRISVGEDYRELVGSHVGAVLALK